MKFPKAKLKAAIKNLLLHVALAAILLICAGEKTIFSQKTADSTQKPAAAAAANSHAAEAETRRKQLIEALERAQTEVRAARALIDGLEEQIEAKEASLKKLRQINDLQAAAIESQTREISNLKSALDAQKQEIKIRTETADFLKKELKKLDKKLKNSQTREKFLIGALGIAVLFGILR